MIDHEIENIKEIALEKGIQLTDEKAFDILTVQFLCFKDANIREIWYDINNCITDGSNDGGIDYIYFDEDEGRIIIGQNKYSRRISTEDFATEISKITRTLSDFDKASTGKYNNKVKRMLQNALDRLTDENQGNIELYFSSLSAFNEEKALKKAYEDEKKVNSINIFNESDLEETIAKLYSNLETVQEYKLKLDRPQNVLKYETNDQQGVVVNISSESLTRLYNSYHTEGLFNLNIRRFVRYKKVDDGIKHSLDKDRDDFWFLNNGLTIACGDYDVSGDTIKLYDFSIVNGGQTTTLIGTYKGNNEQEFFIPCKVIMNKDENMDLDDQIDFYNKIAEATNSQKPIQPRDLKSNSREMISLRNMLLKRDIDLEIKGGSKNIPNKTKIRNDEFAQIMYSFVNQKPGTSRSNKKGLFENNKHYSAVFKNRYKDPDIIDFTVDLVELNVRFDRLMRRYKQEMAAYFNIEQAAILSNAKMALFALFGVVYRLVNNDIDFIELVSDTDIASVSLKYGSFISNYKEDDIDNKLHELILYLVDELVDSYDKLYSRGDVTSVSNFLKKDGSYTEDILKSFSNTLQKERRRSEIFDYGSIFKRK